MTAPGDLLHRFLFEHLPVRGHLVRLDASWRAAIEHHEYPEPVAAALGEAMAASALMAGALKFEGRLSLQFEGPGPVRLLLAQCTHRHAIRGVARHDEVPPGAVTEGGLFGDGQLAVTIEQQEGSERYQGVVPLESERLAANLEAYFERSEQLPSRLVLAATPDRVAGLLLQRVALGDGGRQFLQGLKELFTGKIKTGPMNIVFGFINLFVGVLEIFSHLTRKLSFTFRLFGNMTAGEILILVSCFLVPLVFTIPFYVLELLIGMIQALILSGLTLVFGTIAISPHEESHD